MSGEICVDARIPFIPESLKCKPAEKAADDGSQSSSSSKKAKKVASLPKTAPKVARSLAQYRAALIGDAFPEEKAPNKPSVLPEGNPIAKSLLGGILVASSISCGGGETTPAADGNTPISDAGVDSGPKDSGTTNDAGDSGTDGGTGTIPGTAVAHATAPCGSDSSIPDLDDEVGVCARYSTTGPEDPPNHQLFSWDPLSSDSTLTLLNLPQGPDQVLKSSLNDEIFITSNGNITTIPAQSPGLLYVASTSATQAEVKPFPLIVLGSPELTSSGRSIDMIAPTFPKGLAENSNLIFVTTSNFNTTHSDYLPGRVMAYHRTTGNWYNIPTSSFNPTGIALQNDKLYVVNTGAVDFNGIATTESSIDIFDSNSLELIQNIPLGTVAAGISGEITLTSDGNKMILPTGDNSGNLIVVDLTDGTSQTINVTTGEKVLLTGVTIHPNDETVYVSNFNDGTHYTVNLTTGQVVDSQLLDSTTDDAFGISDSLLSGASLFVGVGDQIMLLPLE